jgi:hypothetical protein
MRRSQGTMMERLSPREWLRMCPPRRTCETGGFHHMAMSHGEMNGLKFGDGMEYHALDEAIWWSRTPVQSGMLQRSLENIISKCLFPMFGNWKKDILWIFAVIDHNYYALPIFGGLSHKHRHFLRVLTAMSACRQVSHPWAFWGCHEGAGDESSLAAAKEICWGWGAAGVGGSQAVDEWLLVWL